VIVITHRVGILKYRGSYYGVKRRSISIGWRTR